MPGRGDGPEAQSNGEHNGWEAVHRGSISRYARTQSASVRTYGSGTALISDMPDFLKLLIRIFTGQAQSLRDTIPENIAQPCFIGQRIG